MTGRLTASVLGILSWMKEHQSETYTSLDEIAARFDLDRDQMRRNLQWLQRHECVKRGGRENAAWSITDQGLVRLTEDRFSLSGAFLSPFDQAETFSASRPDQARPPTVSAAPI
ncbi:MAG TPA: hypothetical protein VNL16_18060, partial [Chloroflexota bacterium]|nr:hypothetical protein [Chloroflexota bacterium]